MSKLKFILIAIFTLLALVHARQATAQDIGGTEFVDGEGVVEQATYILADSDNQGIDAYTETDNFDFTGEDVEYVGAFGQLFDQNNVVDYGDNYTDNNAELDLGANTNVGDTYTVLGMSGACLYLNYDNDDYMYECNYVWFSAYEYQLTTGLPKITQITPNSVNQGASGTLTVNGQNLVDDFGNSQATVSGSGVTATVQNPDPTQKTRVTVQYSVDAAATVGVRNFGITTNFGASDSGKNFTVGYPPAVITNVSPSIWQAGTSLTATITGTGFGTAPTVSISAPGVSAGTSTVTNGGSSIQVPITVAANAPNESVSISVQPGYAGNSYMCGVCNGQSPNGSSTVEVTPITGNPTINLEDGTTASPNAGQPISLSLTPPAGLQITNQTWSFSNPLDVISGYSASAVTGSQVNNVTTSALSNAQLDYYYIVPQQKETVSVSVTYNNGTSGSATSIFNVQGPTGATITPTMGSVRIVPAQFDYVDGYDEIILGGVLGPGGAGSVGVSFLASSTLPQSNQGAYSWVQLLSRFTASLITPGVGISVCPEVSGAAQLDNTYPYGTEGGSLFKTVIADDTATDAPNNQLFAANTEESLQFSATMYLMWTPSGSRTIPIPLSSIKWGVNENAINTLQLGQTNLTTWVQVSCSSGSNGTCSSSSPVTDATNHSYPIWDDTYINTENHVNTCTTTNF